MSNQKIKSHSNIKSNIIPTYEIEKKKHDSYIQIYLVSKNEYSFYGIIPPDVEEFYLVIRKEDEERLPIAIQFEISEMNHICYQYQMIQSCFQEDHLKKENIVLDFPYDQLSHYYHCPISPRFPFATEIYGSIKLKTL
jgi:hypothetical protein